jgi:hypothetical protein
MRETIEAMRIAIERNEEGTETIQGATKEM